MSKLPYKQSVTSHGLSLRLFEICVPEQSSFPDLIQQLLDHSFALENRQRSIPEKTLIARPKTCALFIEGLFQAFCSPAPNTAVVFSNSQSSYKQGQPDKVSHHSFRNVNACYTALVNLGWATYCRGFVDAAGQNHPTTLAPFGELLDRFASTQPFWRRMTSSAETVIVRLKEYGSDLRQTLETPETDEVCLMRQQLHRINGFLADQAIHLSLTNDKLTALGLRMASKRYSYWPEHGRRRVDTKVLNFSQVSLRRIFAKGRLDRGGRFYKGWWQTIPKQFRRYITINGQPALEVDFSEMHPTMLYLLSGQSPPDNIYDLGIRALQDPPYDPEIEPHKSRRKLVKQFINALINDEHGQHRLSVQASKKLGLSHEQLKQLLLDKHPVIGKALRTDTGLYLQYLDSEIACRVMLRLIDQSIVVLPIHDSFIVQSEFEPELVQAMRLEFAIQFNAEARLKDAELPQNGFEELGRRYPLKRLIDAHKESLHDRYLRSWFQQHPQPAHPNLSLFPPYRFPDGQLATF